MKQTKQLPFKDIVVVDDADTIRALSVDQNIDRQFKTHGLLNRFKIKRSLKDLSFHGTRFPHMTEKNDTARIARHTALWEQFNEKADYMASGPDELELIAK